jgi:LacI family transcriptional regulator
VAVIGANNEEDICLSCNPTLTSVPDRSRRIGQLGMESLDEHILSSGTSGPGDTLLDPFPVVARGSTDVLHAVNDPDLSAALTFIREHLHEGIGVQQVVDQVGISRRTLESRFKTQLGRSPLEEIHRLRLDLIRQLLRDTPMGLREITDACGLATVNHLCGFFKKHEGITPGDFRDRMREQA